MKKQRFRFMVIVIICIIIQTGCMAKGNNDEEFCKRATGKFNTE